MKHLLFFLLPFFFVKQSQAGTHHADTIPVPNYTVMPRDIYDLSGYFTNDPNHGSNWFDAFGHIDPKNGITSYAGNKWDTTFGCPDKIYGQYFQSGYVDNTWYPGNRGARVIFDFGGFKDALDTTKKFVFTDIYGYNQTYNGNAKMYFYNLDKVLRMPMAERWKYLSRPDSLLTPFDSLTTTASPGTWIKVPANDSMRYMMVRMVLNSQAKVAEFAELVFYGHHNYDPAAVTGTLRPSTYTGAMPSKKKAEYTFGQTIGTGHLNGVDTNQMIYNGPVRTYVGLNYFDTTNSKNYNKFYFWTSGDVGPAQLGYYKRNGKKMWYTNQGSSSYVSNTGHNNGWNINDQFLEPENPANYTRSGDFNYNFAAKYGSVAVPAGNTKWVGDNGYPNGLNLVAVMENGNEVEAHGASYMADFMKTSVDYDGHNNTIGTLNRTGVKAADPNMPMMMSGMVAPDTNKVKTFWLLAQFTRADKKFPADIVNVHKYFSNRDYLPIGQTFDYNLQIGMHAESAEAENGTGVLTMFDQIGRSVWNYLDTSYKIIMTENGQGNWGTPAKTVQEAGAVWDIYCTPPFGTYDSLQAKAILRSRLELLLPFTPLAWYNEYAQMNQFGDPSNNHYQLFYSYGAAGDRAGSPPYNLRLLFPMWYYRACFYSNLKNYYPDAIVQNGGATGLWQVRYRNMNYPDSICNVIWKGSYNGSTLTGQRISINGSSVTKIHPSFTQVTGTVTTMATSAGVITVDVDERPVMYFSKENTTSGNQPPVANAGADQVITLPVNNISLNGSASADPDGAITSYAWSMIGGPAQYTIASAGTVTTNVSGLVQGVYSFRLLVTDNAGATAADTIRITVNAVAANNQPPVAKAGTDVSITLPVNAVSLNGSASGDPDGTITNYSWSKIGGPAQFTMTNAVNVTTNISGLAQGVYSFRLAVTDNAGATAGDTVNVTVNAASVNNQPPVANAGTDVVIAMPINTTMLNGSASADADGTITGYTWSKISGPSQYAIANTGMMTTNVSNLVQGTYLFRLAVSDNGGAVAADTIAVNVTASINAGTGTGLRGDYFNTANLSGAVALSRIDTTVNFNWQNASPAAGVNTDNFSVRWSGQVQPQFSETYTFYTMTDDGVRLWVNGQQLVNDWVGHSPKENSGTIVLVAGQKYDIVMEYFDQASGASAKLSWSSMSTAKIIIPKKQLYPTPAVGGAGVGLQGDYFNSVNLLGSVVVSRIDTTVNFNWLNTSPAVSINTDNFSVRWSGQVEPQFSETYTFYTMTDDGVRLWVNGQQLVNDWTGHSPKENSGTITLMA